MGEGFGGVGVFGVNDGAREPIRKTKPGERGEIARSALGARRWLAHKGPQSFATSRRDSPRQLGVDDPTRRGLGLDPLQSGVGVSVREAFLPHALPQHWPGQAAPIQLLCPRPRRARIVERAGLNKLGEHRVDVGPYTDTHRDRRISGQPPQQHSPQLRHRRPIPLQVPTGCRLQPRAIGRRARSWRRIHPSPVGLAAAPR